MHRTWGFPNVKLWFLTFSGYCGGATCKFFCLCVLSYMTFPVCDVMWYDFIRHDVTNDEINIFLKVNAFLTATCLFCGGAMQKFL